MPAARGAGAHRPSLYMILAIIRCIPHVMDDIFESRTRSSVCPRTRDRVNTAPSERIPPESRSLAEGRADDLTCAERSSSSKTPFY
ncbi:hypothetical protein GY45DRAFT_1050133 [Cubamyces sp. BRFM 1775]|nr:hypothetical protein GY45DRAFT_1050133 [Cubamyces sp. BRFM 1775]